MSTDTREALAALHQWMPLQEAMRLASIWTDGVDLDNAPQWKAAIKVLSEEVAALATQPAQPSAPIDAFKLYAELRDLVAEAGAVDTLIGRPEVLRSRLADLCKRVGQLTTDLPLGAAQPSAQGEAVAWLVEWKADGYGPQWWGFNHTPGKNGTWCSDANNAIRFARKEDAERMRLHIIAVAGLTGMHDYERSVSVTEHMWVGPRRAE